MMVLVDTCVFIDFLRGKSLPTFVELAKSGQILLSPIIKLELLQGARTQELAILNRTLKGFTEIEINSETMKISEKLLLPLKNRGITVGIPDLLIVAQAIQSNSLFYTTDLLLLKTQAKVWPHLHLYKAPKN